MQVTVTYLATHHIVIHFAADDFITLNIENCMTIDLDQNDSLGSRSKHDNSRE